MLPTPLLAALLATQISLSEGPVEPQSAGKTAAPPYSLPFALRPAAASNVLRLDTVLALSEAATTVPVLALASWKLSPDFSLLARFGVVINSTGEETASGVAIPNIALGGTYVLKPFPAVRTALFLGLTLPMGSGGGDEPEASTRTAVVSGILARSAMDNALFAVNYLTVFPGASIAWVDRGWTLQAELTLLFLNRVRGDQMDPDAFRLNLTSGLHAGYFLTPAISIAAELRYQRWLINETVLGTGSTPRADNLTVAAGPRLHLQVSPTAWFRPGISFAFGLDAPMGFSSDGQKYKIVQLDLPLIF